MLKYEFKKYILKPSVLICLIIFLFINFVKFLEIYYSYGGRTEFFREKESYLITKDMLYEKYNGLITNEKIDSVKRELEIAAEKLKKYGIVTEPIEDTYTGYPYGDLNIFTEIKNEITYAVLYKNDSYKISQNALKNAEFYAGKSSFEELNNKLIFELYRDREVNDYIKGDGYEKLFDYKFSTLLSMFLLVFILSPIFAAERKTGYDKLIVSSGKAKKVIHAKLLTAVMATFIISFILFVSDIIFSKILYGIDNLSSPIYSIEAFSLCPFELTFIGGMAVTFIFRFLFLMMFSFIVTAVSSFSKSELISISISSLSGILIVVGSEHFPGFLYPSYLIGTKEIFSSYKVINALGFPVFSFIVPIIEIIVICIAAALIIRRYGKKCF